MKLLVYVAGPITSGDRWENIQTGLAVGRELAREGFAPFVPHLDTFLGLEDLVGYEHVLQCDEAILAKCDALVRIPGESPGADREVKFAKQHDVKVFYNVASLIAWRDDRVKKLSRKGCATCRGI